MCEMLFTLPIHEYKILLLLPSSQFLLFIGIKIQKQALYLQQTLTADPHNRLLTTDHPSTTCVTQSTTSAAAADDSPSTSRLHNAQEQFCLEKRLRQDSPESSTMGTSLNSHLVC
jgi:hypothetical protein